MNSEQFEPTFASALRESGPAYMEARKAILASSAGAPAFLETKQRSQDWKAALQARILAGWINQPALFTRCVSYSEGKMPGKPGITGKFRPMERVREIVRLGPAVTLCLIEMILKLRPLEGEQSAAVFGAIKEMGGKEAVLPLISLLIDENVDIRAEAAGVLGPLGDSSAVPPLLTLLGDASQPADVRASAAASLGELHAPEASAVLQRIVRSNEQSLDLRRAAVRALDGLRDSTATPALLEAVSSASDLLFLTVLVETLGKIGDRTALPVLEKLQTHSDAFIRDAAKQSHRRAVSR